jgi:hypothetical protein
MEREQVKNNTSVTSRMAYLTDETDKKIANFIMDYADLDENGIVVVPMFRVLDAILQKGEPYCEG